MSETALTKIEQKKKLLSEVLDTRRKDIYEMGLFSEEEGKRFIKVVMTSVATNPKLLDCTMESLILAVYDAAQCGLAPNSVTQEGHLIPFYSSKKKSYECVFVVGYRGVINMLYATGHFELVDVYAVYEHDEFFEALGSDPKIHHIPKRDGDRGKFIGSYALLKFKGGSTKHYYVSEFEGTKHMKRFCKSKSKSGEVFGPWKDDFEAMVMKTALKKVAKYCPTSPATQKLYQAITFDEKQEIPSSLPENKDIKTPQPLIDPDTGDEIPAEIAQ